MPDDRPSLALRTHFGNIMMFIHCCCCCCCCYVSDELLSWMDVIIYSLFYELGRLFSSCWPNKIHVIYGRIFWERTEHKDLFCQKKEKKKKVQRENRRRRRRKIYWYWSVSYLVSKQSRCFGYVCMIFEQIACGLCHKDLKRNRCSSQSSKYPTTNCEPLIRTRTS